MDQVPRLRAGGLGHEEQADRAVSGVLRRLRGEENMRAKTVHTFKTTVELKDGGEVTVSNECFRVTRAGNHTYNVTGTIKEFRVWAAAIEKACERQEAERRRLGL